MRMREKIKGGMVFVCGLFWIILVYNFDRLMNKPTLFGLKAALGFVMGIIMVINGVRIYFRK